MIKKIVSGGQTGCDLAALDVAIELNIPYGGWCPRDRINEAGRIPEKYINLQEVAGEFKNEVDNYAMRTVLNIRDSDATLIFVPRLPFPSQINDGTLLTIAEVKKQNKPYYVMDLSGNLDQNIKALISWLKLHDINTLNVAGPRETSSPGIYARTVCTLKKLLFRTQADHKQLPTAKM